MAFWTWFQANCVALARALQAGDIAEVEGRMKEGRMLMPPRLGWEMRSRYQRRKYARLMVLERVS